MNKTILDYFDKIYTCYPNKIALVDSKREATFKTVSDEAHKIANALFEFAENKSPVVVYLDKSIEAVISFLGIVYSGNFYSPIDPDMPMERIKIILKTLKPVAIVTSRKYCDLVKNYGYKVLIYEDIILNYTTKITSERRIDINNNDILYVLFTSGSTGIPKGVMIQQYSVINYITWLSKTFDINQDSCLGNQAPLYFDNSVLDIYSCILLGATVYLIEKELFTQPIRLVEQIKNNSIDTIFWVPSVFNFLVKFNTLDEISLQGYIKNVLFAGEVMPTKTINYLINHLGKETVFANLYGPTEATVDCTYYIIKDILPASETIPIGKAIDNVEVMVISETGELISCEDEIGELCVKGCCLSKGYYNNPEKTKEVFVLNPFRTIENEIIYKTGDYVKYNSSGQLIYIARKDQQIKHLGNRIELGEIEAATMRIQDINNCCCCYDSQKKRIILFVESELETSRIKSELRKLIPGYMIPHKVIHMEHLPLNSNGKIDRIKLKESL